MPVAAGCLGAFPRLETIQRVGVAVSGGADPPISMEVLWEIARFRIAGSRSDSAAVCDLEFSWPVARPGSVPPGPTISSAVAEFRRTLSDFLEDRSRLFAGVYCVGLTHGNLQCGDVCGGLRGIPAAVVFHQQAGIL